MPEALSLLDAALRGALIALLLLIAVALLRDRSSLPATRAAVAMCIGLVIQVFSSLPQIEAHMPVLWQAPLIAVSVGNAVLFWIFVQALFDDEFSLRRYHGLIWLAVAALSAFNCVIGPRQAVSPVTFGLQRAVPLVFAVLAAMAAARHWRSDLVEGRRRVRAFIVTTGIFYTLAMLVARLASPNGRLTGATVTVDVAVLLIIVIPAAWRLLQVGGTELFPSDGMPAPAPREMSPDGATPRPAEPPPAMLPAPVDPAEDRLAESLQQLMTQERAFRSEDLSVASLATRLAVPEYRLRRLINQRLGHRNFNVYVNGFRLAEARAVLADPAKRELPVLTIALDAGFGSIGPFNRAFKTVTGQTPTEFRREKLADS